MSRFKKYFYLVLLLALTTPLSLKAEEGTSPALNPSEGTSPPLGPTSFNITIPNPLKGISSLEEFVKAILDNIVLPIGSVVVVMAIIYAGFKFVTAQGKPEKLKEAKDAFLWVLIGAAILLGSWLIANAIKGTVDQLLVLG